MAIPPGFEDTLTALLAGLPDQPGAGDVTDRVSARLPVARVNPDTGHGYVPPAVESAVEGHDVGVSLWEGVGEGCLLGARIDGEVTVWRPSSVQLQPGELRCEAQTALRLDGLHPPH